MTARLRVSAPGKLMIAGEYAVLSGGTCLVTAVDRRAFATLDDDGSGAAGHGSPGASPRSPDRPVLTPEVRVARRRAETLLGPVPATLTLSIDVTALRNEEQGTKLGLGSSAAGAAAAAGVIFAHHGHDLTDEAVRMRVLEVALSGHREVAPEGSGADVAAAVLGGFVTFRRANDDIDVERVAWPKHAEVAVVWTGVEAKTSELVRRVNVLKNGDPARHDGLVAHISRAAQALIGAAKRGDAPAIVDAARAHGDAMAALGDASGAPIVEARHREVMRLAAEAGGAAKPSGAGGGDVAVAFFADRTARDRFEVACAKHDFALLSLTLGEGGVVREPDAP